MKNTGRYKGIGPTSANVYCSYANDIGPTVGVGLLLH